LISFVYTYSVCSRLIVYFKLESRKDAAVSQYKTRVREEWKTAESKLLVFVFPFPLLNKNVLQAQLSPNSRSRSFTLPRVLSCPIRVISGLGYLDLE